MIKSRQFFSLPSLLNIIGIAIAISAFFVLIAIADFELTFNKSIPKHENIYQINSTIGKGKPCNYMMRPLLETMCKTLPSVDKYGCLTAVSSGQIFIKRNGIYNATNALLYGCSSGLLDVFGFKFIEGDTSRFFNFNHIIISEKSAKLYSLKVGDVVKLDPQNDAELEIVAIYEDFEANTEFANINGFQCIGDYDITNASEWSYIYYTRLIDNAPKIEYDSACQNTIQQIVRQVYKESQSIAEEQVEQGLATFSMEFVTLDDLYLHSEIDGYHVHGDKNVTYTLVILAFFIIIIAYINYFNFFMARVPHRLRSINTRKVLGSDRGSLIAEIVGESVIFTVIAIVLATLLLYCAMKNLVGEFVNMNDIVFSNYKMLSFTILTSLAAAILTSLYPAFHITSITPALALKGQLTQNGNSALRYFLIGFQITASIILIICSLFIDKNNDYLLNRNIGFNRDNLLTTFTTKKISDNQETTRACLLSNPDILDITWSSAKLVRQIGMKWGRQDPNDKSKTWYYDVLPVAWNFLNFMDIKITEGRDFTATDEHSENGVIIFNETAQKEFNMNIDSPCEGHKDSTTCELAGFCNDFNFKPLQYGISPYAFYVFGKDSWKGFSQRNLYIRIAANADVQKTIDFIHETLVSIDPDYETTKSQIITFDEELSYNYTTEKKHGTLITLFTIIAIIISVMGIFGIVLFDTERRRNEIGIRKVNGATVWDILLMFNIKFIILTAICSVIATPIAYLATNKYFSEFVYHYDINASIFIRGIIIVFAITVIVVTAASLKAANENPIETIKTE